MPVYTSSEEDSDSLHLKRKTTIRKVKTFHRSRVGKKNKTKSEEFYVCIKTRFSSYLKNIIENNIDARNSSRRNYFNGKRAGINYNISGWDPRYEDVDFDPVYGTYNFNWKMGGKVEEELKLKKTKES